MSDTVFIVLVVLGVAALVVVLVQTLVLNSRVTAIERSQDSGTKALSAALNGVQTSLSSGVSGIQGNLTVARERLSEIQSYTEARQDLERRTSESIRRLELVIAGTRSKGMGGENLLESLLSQLPVEWRVNDFRVAGKPVEFGLRLPNGLVLPIDSKWPATGLIEEFASCNDDGLRQRLKGAIEQETVSKVREVCKYIIPSRTTPFAIVAVPDVVYEVAKNAQVEAMKLNVTLLGYSMVLPYVLLAFHTIGELSRDIDIEKLGTYLSTIEAALHRLQEELDGRFARALTMLANSRSDLAVELGRLSVGLGSIRISSGVMTASSAEATPDLAREFAKAAPSFDQA